MQPVVNPSSFTCCMYVHSKPHHHFIAVRLLPLSLPPFPYLSHSPDAPFTRGPEKNVHLHSIPACTTTQQHRPSISPLYGTPLYSFFIFSYSGLSLSLSPPNSLHHIYHPPSNSLHYLVSCTMSSLPSFLSSPYIRILYPHPFSPGQLCASQCLQQSFMGTRVVLQFQCCFVAHFGAGNTGHQVWRWLFIPTISTADECILNTHFNLLFSYFFRLVESCACQFVLLTHNRKLMFLFVLGLHLFSVVLLCILEFQQQIQVLRL